MGYFYIFLTIAFTIYGQLIIKWQVSQAGLVPADPVGKASFLLGLVLNPWVMSGFLAAFVAGLAWMLVLTKFPLNYAYPFMSLAFIGVMGLSAHFFLEALNPAKILGMALVVVGLAVGSQEW